MSTYPSLYDIHSDNSLDVSNVVSRIKCVIVSSIFVPGGTDLDTVKRVSVITELS